MAFHYLKDALNHSPQWYRAHCSAEDGGSPALRAMLKVDVRILDCDDKKMCYEEKVGLYEDEWNDVLAGKSTVVSVTELEEVLQRDGVYENSPAELYSKPPFTQFARLMKKEGLSTTDLDAYLKWKAKDDNLKKARAAKATKRKKSGKDDPPLTLEPFFVTSRRRQPLPEL